MNPMDLLKNFQNIQGKLAEFQSKLAELEATGTSGGDMVKITLNGKLEMTGIRISRDVVDPEDVQMLQDLILAAFNDAFSKIKEKMKSESSSIAGGLNIPPEFMGM
ncbi:MAG: YbaB/EbfC family nucleoid-associated protein [Spirochaetales bacterium]|nr:YbaB/EbfC family nucleoid-associated protein [Spirochaetales bacterium]